MLISGKAALGSVAGYVAMAAAKIWAWASAIPFVGIGLAIAGVAALAASIWAIKAKFMAEGGIITRPTLAVVGERGPEAIVPLGKALGGMTVNITVQGTVIAERDLAISIRDELLKLKARNVTTGL